MKVLLVEDHPGLAKISTDLLTQVHGHEVRHAASGQDALSIIQTFVPDVVLLDLNLPDMHGYRLAEQLRAQPRFDRTVIVALTGFGITGDQQQSEAVGIDAHYRKPMNFADLPEIKRRPRGEAAANKPTGTS